MRRRDFLATSGASLLLAMRAPAIHAMAVPEAFVPPTRGLRIAVDPRAGAATQKAVAQLLESVPSNPLLTLMAGADKPRPVDTTKLIKSSNELTYNHLILIGGPDDPLIQQVWQREAKIADKAMYVFGFGGFSGDLGYVESDRNPYLHGIAVRSAPFEAEVITLTGTSDDGIALAVQHLAESGLVNGIVARPGWKRTETTLLDRDPLAPKFQLPKLATDKIGDYMRIACMQAAEDEYRGVLEDTGVEPQQIWRVKYHKAGAWDGKGAITAFDAYANGLHRRAYGSTLWLARFSSAAEAAQAAPKIADTAKLVRAGDQWKGAQPAYANGTYPGEKKSSGPLSLWCSDEWVVMSTLDAAL